MLEERDLLEFSAGTSCIHIGSDICIYLSYYIYSNGIFKYFQTLGLVALILTPKPAHGSWPYSCALSM